MRGFALRNRTRTCKEVSDHAGAVEKTVHESGPLSIWQTREQVKRGAPVVCIDARAANKALSARMNKSDTSDVETPAQLARTGWYREVHIKLVPGSPHQERRE